MMKKLFSAALFLLLFINTSCSITTEFDSFNAAVNKNFYNPGEEINLNLKYKYTYKFLDEKVEFVDIMVTIEKKYSEEEMNENPEKEIYHKLGYNPFTDSFNKYIKENQQYIVEEKCKDYYETKIFDNLYDREGFELVLTGNKIFEADETFQFILNETGEYRIYYYGILVPGGLRDSISIVDFTVK